MRPRHLLVEERREPALIDRRRQRFLADARRTRGSSTQPPTLPFSRPSGAVRAHHLDLGGVVGERGADLVALELVVLVATNRERRTIRVERAVEALRRRRAARTRGAAASAAPDLLRRPECRTSCRHSRSCRRSSPSRRSTTGRRCRTRCATASSRRRLRRVHIARAAPAAAERAARACRCRRARRRPRRLRSPRCRDRTCRLPLTPIMRLRRDLVGDDVDEPADRIRAVEQRRRTAHDLDPLGRRRD